MSSEPTHYVVPAETMELVTACLADEHGPAAYTNAIRLLDQAVKVEPTNPRKEYEWLPADYLNGRRSRVVHEYRRWQEVPR